MLKLMLFIRALDVGETGGNVNRATLFQLYCTNIVASTMSTLPLTFPTDEGRNLLLSICLDVMTNQHPEINLDPQHSTVLTISPRTQLNNNYTSLSVYFDLQYLV